MKLYRSLIFRELKISRRHYAARALLMAGFAALLFLAVFVAWQEDIAKASPQELKDLRYIVDMFGMMFALLTAVLAMYDADVMQSDVNCGWLRYSYALPITAKDKALAHYTVKAGAIVIGGILCGVFAAILEKPLGQQLVSGALNTYLTVLDAMLLAELLRGVLMAAGAAEKQARLFGMLYSTVLILGAAFWLYISYFSDFLANIDEMMENGADISAEFVSFASGVMDTAEGLSFIPFVGLVLLMICSFLVSAKAQERREP